MYFLLEHDIALFLHVNIPCIQLRLSLAILGRFVFLVSEHVRMRFLFFCYRLWRR